MKLKKLTQLSDKATEEDKKALEYLKQKFVKGVTELRLAPFWEMAITPEDVPKVLSSLKDQPFFKPTLIKLISEVSEETHLSWTLVEIFARLLSNTQLDLSNYIIDKWHKFSRLTRLKIQLSLSKKGAWLWDTGVVEYVSSRAGLIVEDSVELIDSSNLPERISDLRRFAEQGQAIPIDRLLGQYVSEERKIILYEAAIQEVSKHLKCDSPVLRTVVLFHEAAHAILHLGKDLDRKALGLHDKMSEQVHETFAQLFCYYICKDDPELMDCFEKLDNILEDIYRHWRDFEDIGLEKIRKAMLNLRESTKESICLDDVRDFMRRI